MEATVTASATAFGVVADPELVREVERLGDEIAELAAHLDAAVARLLTLIREFDERAGWNNGFRSCAHWPRGASDWISGRHVSASVSRERSPGCRSWRTRWLAASCPTRRCVR